MSTKKLGRVMWTHSHCGDDIVLRSTNPSGQRSPALLLDLSDPAALVEKVAVELLNYQISLFGMHGHNADDYFDSREAAKRIATRALGVPASLLRPKLLKEMKKK